MKILLLGAFGFLFVLIWASVAAGNHHDAPALASDGSGYTVAEALPAPRASDVGRVDYAPAAQAPDDVATPEDRYAGCAATIHNEYFRRDNLNDFDWAPGYIHGKTVSIYVRGRNVFNVPVTNIFRCP